MKHLLAALIALGLIAASVATQAAPTKTEQAAKKKKPVKKAKKPHKSPFKKKEDIKIKKLH
jgi:hypothetical protein